jgi:hypothetical protein
VVGGGLTQYEGETGIIYLAGQMFYVTIPGISVPPDNSGTAPGEEPCDPEEEECEEPEEPCNPQEEECEEPGGDPGDPGGPVDPPAACEEPQVLGANVQFVDGEDVTSTEFVPGETILEVQANASGMLFGAEGWEDFQVVGSLGCGMPPQ